MDLRTLAYEQAIDALNKAGIELDKGFLTYFGGTPHSLLNEKTTQLNPDIKKRILEHIKETYQLAEDLGNEFHGNN
jgi:hypothetical protein